MPAGGCENCLCAASPRTQLPPEPPADRVVKRTMVSETEAQKTDRILLGRIRAQPFCDEPSVGVPKAPSDRQSNLCRGFTGQQDADTRTIYRRPPARTARPDGSCR